MTGSAFTPDERDAITNIINAGFPIAHIRQTVNPLEDPEVWAAYEQQVADILAGQKHQPIAETMDLLRGVTPRIVAGQPVSKRMRAAHYRAQLCVDCNECSAPGRLHCDHHQQWKQGPSTGGWFEVPQPEGGT